jgi:hypothetical protein
MINLNSFSNHETKATISIRVNSSNSWTENNSWIETKGPRMTQISTNNKEINKKPN